VTEVQGPVRRALESVAPDLGDARGDWDRVLGDAARAQRRGLAFRAAVVVGVAAAAGVVALLAPAGSERAGIVERARAALGEGPVVHLVVRGSWGGATVDLETGTVRPLHAETEGWYDPERGLHEISRLGGARQFENFSRPGSIQPQARRRYRDIANRYRQALDSRRARVVARGSVGGRPVHWVRLESSWHPDVADGRDHLMAFEAAVDRKTFEPVFFRHTRDGRHVSGTGQEIVKLEFLPEGEGDFTADPPPRRPDPPLGSMRYRELGPAAARRALEGRALWVGPSFAGKNLARTRELVLQRNRQPLGLSLYYGKLRRSPTGMRLEDPSAAWLQLGQWNATGPLMPLAAPPPAGLDLREGLAYVAGRHALLRRDGVHVSIHAKSVREALSAAGALRPYGDPRNPSWAPAVKQVGAVALAAEIERSRSAPRLVGEARVKPRPHGRPGPPTQEGSARGVTVRVRPPDMAVFDTTGAGTALRRLLRGNVTYACMRLSTTHGWHVREGGAWAAFRGTYSAVLTGVRAPFDACELRGSYGRRWGSSVGWHSAVEIPFNAKAERFFAERAAARELAYFARSRVMRSVRRELRRGRPSPSAETIAERAGNSVVAIRGPDSWPPEGNLGVWTRGARVELSKRVAGQRLFVEIRRGKIVKSNIRQLAFAF
jgi:hypothetical protein